MQNPKSCYLEKNVKTKIEENTKLFKFQIFKFHIFKFQIFKEPVKSFDGMFRKMKISLYDN